MRFDAYTPMELFGIPPERAWIRNTSIGARALKTSFKASCSTSGTEKFKCELLQRPGADFENSYLAQLRAYQNIYKS